MLSAPHSHTVLIAGRPTPEFNRTRRSSQSEILDAAVDGDELSRILRDLARFNGAMLGHLPVLQWLERATRDLPANRMLTLVDVGCGYGDLLRAVRRWARRRQRHIRLVGIDMNPQVVEIARGATVAADQIEYEVSEVSKFKPYYAVDFITSSLVTHHLSDAAIVRFLRLMENTARCGWVIYDLQRSVVPFYFIAFAGALMRLHPVVVYDGRISVARSLTRSEWNELISRAGISPEVIDLHWFMFRFSIGRLR
jgi:2-polyprenyl-3-methyl-5-hydroxy-6-metoxy-1,4-benzoquinol methylase